MIPPGQLFVIFISIGIETLFFNKKAIRFNDG